MAYLDRSYARDRRERRWQLVSAALATHGGSQFADVLRGLED